MKENIKLFESLQAADGYAINDIPFITTVKREEVSLEPQNLHCNEEDMKIQVSGSSAEIISIFPSNTILHLTNGTDVEINSSAITSTMTSSYKNSLRSVEVGRNTVNVSDGAFYGFQQLQSATIYGGTIGPSAFNGCSGLSKVTICKNVTEIGDRAFRNTRLTNLDLPNNINIGEFAFSGCSSLRNVIIRGGTIGHGAFKELRYLNNITFGEGLTSIGKEAFEGCRGLSGSLVIPNSVTNIGEDAFMYCTGITGVSVSSGVTIGRGAFRGCKSLPVIDNLRYVDNWYVCEAVNKTQASYVLPSSVKKIGDSAFDGCSGMTNVVIPNGVLDIGANAFSQCSGLTSIVIPDSVTSVGVYAFEHCTSLTSVTIPDSVTNIGDYLFSNCANLKSVTFPSGMTKINVYMFSGCTSLNDVTMPTGITEIGAFAFRGCAFSSMTIPDSVTVIGGNSFGACTALVSVNIPSGVTEVQSFIFDGCTSLSSITIPIGVTQIGTSSFRNCQALNSFNYEGTSTQWASIIKYSDWNKDMAATVVHCLADGVDVPI